MTPPYSSNMLDRPVDGERGDQAGTTTYRAQATTIGRHPAAAPPIVPMAAHPQHQPRPVYVQAPRSGSSSTSTAAMALLIVFAALLAAGAGYLAARASAPGAGDLARYQQVAGAEGFYAGRMQGAAQGRQAGLDAERQVARYKAAIAKQRAWNRGFARGKKQGIDTYRAPRRPSWGGGYGYRPYVPSYRPSYSGGYGGQVAGALATAQSLANSTGAPVDVEIYP